MEDKTYEILHKAFDVNTHKEFFVNYLEVVIDDTGKVEYAVPSHQEKLVQIAMKKLNLKTREELNDMCPKEYYFDFMTWLCKITGCISVWNNFFIGDVNDYQLYALRELKNNGVYKGKYTTIN